MSSKRKLASTEKKTRNPLGNVTRPITLAQSTDTREELVFESYLEEQGEMQLALCQDVSFIKTQPRTDKFVDADGIVHKYTPDFSLRLNGEENFTSELLIEIKPLFHVVKPKWVHKLSLFGRCYAEDDRPYHVLSDDQLFGTPLARTAKILLSHRHSVASPDVLARALDSVTEHGPSRIDVLMRRTGLQLVDVYTLLATRQLSFSHEMRLDKTMVVGNPETMKGLCYEDIRNTGRFSGLLSRLVVGRRPTDRQIAEIAALQRPRRQRADLFSIVGGDLKRAPARSLHPSERGIVSVFERAGLDLRRTLSPVKSPRAGV